MYRNVDMLWSSCNVALDVLLCWHVGKLLLGLRLWCMVHCVCDCGRLLHVNILICNA